MSGIFTYIGIIWKITLGVNVGKYSSTMDPLGYIRIFLVTFYKYTTSHRRWHSEMEVVRDLRDRVRIFQIEVDYPA